MRFVLALSLTLVASIASAGPDAELARARARARIAIEIAKVDMPSESLELQIAKLDAFDAIEAVKADLTKAEKAPTPRRLPAGSCSDKCTCGCRDGQECRCVDLRSSAPPVLSDWERTVLKAQGPVLVDFTAAWCGPCRTMAPTIDRLAGEFSVVKVDVDAQPDLVKRYAVRSIPRLMIFQNGVAVWDKTGVQSESTIRAALAAAAR